jgi:manganese transport system ATP-binding protein
MQPAITVSGLEVRYGGTIALAGVDLDVPLGASLAVIGPNGSGKSTLLGALAGTIEPAAGEIVIAGTTPALVLQSTDVDRSLPITVRDTVSLARYPSLGLLGRFGAADRAAVSEAMSRLSIDDLERRQFHDLSGGQRQRVLVAQGLAQDTSVLLLDEPITGLDVVSRAVILEVVDQEVAAGKSVVMTTHDLDDARRCDQVLLLDTFPIAVGRPDEVLTERNLRRAFGGRFVRVGDVLLLDDPHHSH